MGQSQSHTSPSPPADPPPLSPSSLVVEEDAARSHRPSSAQNSPILSDHPETVWDAIRRQQGFDNLRDVVEHFLKTWSEKELLGLIAKEHGESESDESTCRRFVLRYLDDRDWDDLNDTSRAILLSRMLRDEVDLPGFGFEAALARWEQICDDALNAFEPVGPYGTYKFDERESVTGRIELFMHDYGFATFVAIIQEFHEPGEDMDLLLSKMVRVEGEGEEAKTVVYEPCSTPSMVADHILAWLEHGNMQLAPSEKRAKGSLPEWEDLSDLSDEDEGDEAMPEDQRQSYRSILAAVQKEPLRWRRIYLRVLRYVHTFGMEGAREGLLFFDELEQARQQWAQDGGLERFITPGRRDTPEVRLAANITDCLAIEEREHRRIELPLLLRQSPHSPGSSSASSPSNPSTTLRAPRAIASPRVNEDDYEFLQGELHELREEHEVQLALERALCDEIDELKEQLQEATQDRERESDVEDEHADGTSHCPICSCALPNAKVKETHLSFHRQEINKYRANGGLEPYSLRRPSPSPSPARNATPRSEGSRERQESPPSSPDIPPPQRRRPMRKRRVSTSSNELVHANEMIPRRVVRRKLDAVVIPVALQAPASGPRTTRSADAPATKGWPGTNRGRGGASQRGQRGGKSASKPAGVAKRGRPRRK